MIKIIDGFYKDPNLIRKMALNSKYELISSGNYIGRDTLDKAVMFPELEKNIRTLFPDPHCKVVCSRFRSALEGDTHLTFVHADAYVRDAGWHILISLTKGKVRDGVTLYNHVKHGEMCTGWTPEQSKDTENFEKFVPTRTIEYKYNRAVVLDYSYFHSPMNHTGIGDRLENSRLLHIIEICDDRSSHYKYRLCFPGAGMARNYDPDGGNDNNQSFSSLESDSLANKRVEELVD